MSEQGEQSEQSEQVTEQAEEEQHKPQISFHPDRKRFIQTPPPSGIALSRFYKRRGHQ